MKKLLIIILLLFSFNAYSQVYFSGTRQPLYSTRATQFFDRCVTAGVTLTDAQKSWYNDSIFVPLSDSGLIGATRSGDSIQALWGFATFPNGSASVCVLNLLSDSNTCTAVNSPTFTDSGVVGNGSSSYLNTNFNPTWDSTICKQFSAGFGVYSKSNIINELSLDIGCVGTTSSSYFITHYSSTLNDVRVNSGNLGLSPASLTSTGLIFASRQANNYTYASKNGISLGSSTTITNGKVNQKFYICCYNNQGTASLFSRRVISFAVITSGLSTTKSRALSNILNNSLKGRGYNVY